MVDMASVNRSVCPNKCCWLCRNETTFYSRFRLSQRYRLHPEPNKSPTKQIPRRFVLISRPTGQEIAVIFTVIKLQFRLNHCCAVRSVRLYAMPCAVRAPATLNNIDSNWNRKWRRERKCMHVVVVVDSINLWRKNEMPNGGCNTQVTT